LSFEKVNKLIGEELKKETIKNILASLDIKIISISDSGLGLNIPPYRVDVQREVDVIEEILRVYGYNNIKIPNKINASVSNSSRTDILTPVEGWNYKWLNLNINEPGT
jgi:phenylalanyl-tRNA synthetase beta chain